MTVSEERSPPPYPPEFYPTTVEGLARVVGGCSTHSDPALGYGMFWCMRGVPRAYMDIPALGEFERYIYSVIGFESKLPKEAAEPLLVQGVYEFLKARRLEALKLFDLTDSADNKGDYPYPPVMFVRRDLEISADFEANKTRLTYRICIPGVDLRPYDIHRDNFFTYQQV